MQNRHGGDEARDIERRLDRSFEREGGYSTYKPRQPLSRRGSLRALLADRAAGVGFVIANRDRKLDIRPALRRDR